MAEIKTLQFDEGQEVTPPTDATNYFVKNNFSATTNPGVGDDSDDGYVVGSKWVNTSTDVEYTALDVTVGAAVWKVITPVVSNIDVETKTANYTTTTDDGLILVDAISNDVTITLNSASSNSGQTLQIKRIDDAQVQTNDFLDGNVTVGTDNININSHSFYDLQRVQLTTTGTLPSGLATSTDYYIIYVDANNLKFATSRANAIADTAVDIVAAAGGGTHTITSEVNTVTIDADGSETIDGSLTQTFEIINECLKIISDGTNWQILKQQYKENHFAAVIANNGTATITSQSSLKNPAIASVVRGSTGVINITFTTGFFSVAPCVTANPLTTSTGLRCTIDSISTTTCVIKTRTNDGTGLVDSDNTVHITRQGSDYIDN